MRKIKLTQGKFATVDDEDYPELSKYTWYYKAGYAARRDPNGCGGHLKMHRIIMGAQPGQVVDHINNRGSKTDNRKKNLRLCTRSQNLCNRGKTSRNSSGYKGVTWSKGACKWMAQIAVGGTNKYLGLFENKEVAALAYNRAAELLHGQFAMLNEVNCG